MSLFPRNRSFVRAAGLDLRSRLRIYLFRLKTCGSRSGRQQHIFISGKGTFYLVKIYCRLHCRSKSRAEEKIDIEYRSKSRSKTGSSAGDQ